MNPRFVIPVLFLLLFSGCVIIPPRAVVSRAVQAPHRFDLITSGMTRQLVIEVLGTPKTETKEGRLQWEDRYDAENYDFLEVGFDGTGKAIFIEKTTRTQTISRT